MARGPRALDQEQELFRKQGLLQFRLRLSVRNFVPRIGLAYRVNDRLVIRGGYGLFNEFLGKFTRVQGGGPFEISETYFNTITNGTALFQLPNPFPSGGVCYGAITERHRHSVADEERVDSSVQHKRRAADWGPGFQAFIHRVAQPGDELQHWRQQTSAKLDSLQRGLGNRFHSSSVRLYTGRTVALIMIR